MTNSGLCKLPFQSVMTFNSGAVKMCCVSETLGTLRENSLRDIWNSEKWRKVRREFLSGQQPGECRECWRTEARGAVSSREPVAADDPLLARCLPNGEMPDTPTRLSIRLGTECNLKCIMCGPGNSSKWQEDLDIARAFRLHPEFEEKVPSPSLTEDAWLQSALGDADWIQFIGGEPLIIKRHRTILQFLVDSGRAQDVALMYSTNLTQLPDWCVELWRKFKRIDLRASIDGTGEVYEYIRYPGKWPAVRDNFERLNKIDGVNLDIAILPVFMSVNALNLKSIFQWRNSLSWRTPAAIRPEYLERPDFLAAHHLSEEVKAAALKDLSYLFETQARSDEERTFLRDLSSRLQAPAQKAQQDLLKKYLCTLDQRRAKA